MTNSRDSLLPILADALDAADIDIPMSKVLKLATELASRLSESVPVSAAQRRKWTSWTDEEEKQLAELYTRGTSMAEIARLLDKSPGALKGAVSRLRLTRPSGFKQPGRPPKGQQG